MNDWRPGDRGTITLSGVDKDNNLIQTYHRWRWSIIEDINYYHLINYKVVQDGYDITQEVKLDYENAKKRGNK